MSSPERDIVTSWKTIPAIHQAGYPFICIFALITAGLFWAWYPAGWVGVVLTLWCIYFFRDPDRVTPSRAGAVICPADGIVCRIDNALPPPELELWNAAAEAQEIPWVRVCVFMNVFNVHVNRNPFSGIVKKLAYRPGRFFNASLDKASELNERMSVQLETPEGHTLVYVQIAGLVARRIKCFLKEGQEVVAGERFGLIRFGSRVDVYLPPQTVPLVHIGQTMVAGESVLALLDTPKMVNEINVTL